MVAALWISLAFFVLVSTTLLRSSVRFAAKSSDNGWDNAFAYVAITGLMVAYPIKWMLFSHSILLIALAPILLWAVQAYALRTIYQITPLRALGVGIAHSVMTSFVMGLVMTVAGAIVAYVLYGRIVSDPLGAILILLRWLGVTLPF